MLLFKMLKMMLKAYLFQGRKKKTRRRKQIEHSKLAPFSLSLSLCVCVWHTMRCDSCDQMRFDEGWLNARPNNPSDPTRDSPKYEVRCQLPVDPPRRGAWRVRSGQTRLEAFVSRLLLSDSSVLSSFQRSPARRGSTHSRVTCSGNNNL